MFSYDENIKDKAIVFELKKKSILNKVKKAKLKY